MYSSSLVLTCFYLLSVILKLNQVKCLEDKRRLSNYNEFNSTHLLSNVNQKINFKTEFNSVYNFVNLLFSFFKNSNSLISNDRPQRGSIEQFDQSDSIHLVNKLSKLNLDHSNQFKNKYGISKRLNKIKLTKFNFKLNLKDVFDKIYESNYTNFCACPPDLRNAYHSLQDPINDNEVTDCIYLPNSTVEYQCKNRSENQFKSESKNLPKNESKKKRTNQIVLNKLICDLNPNTNKLEWIIDVYDQLIDLDERFIYEDQFTDDQKKNDWDETVNIKSTQLYDFDIQFLKCEQCKLI